MFLKWEWEIVGAVVVLIYDVVPSASSAEYPKTCETDRAFSPLPL